MHNALHTGLARYFSPEQIDALRSARVGIAGAGGLGSNAALMLARSGIGNMLVVDDDVVDASNLNRQQYWPRHVGRPKVEALAELLLELNPAIQVETRRLRMDQHNIGTLLPACPIWVEAFDGPDDKTLLVETALLGGYRIASASGMGIRSRRFALYVVDGVVRAAWIEQPGQFEVSSAEYVLEHLPT